MDFHLRRQRTSSLERRNLPAGDSAYVLCEQARLRCERLCDGTPAETACGWVKVAHRDLGMAGYLAAGAIFSGRRRELLAIARADAADPGKDEIRGLIEAARGARGAPRHL